MMATGRTLGHIQEYRQETELFSSYMERIELFFVANDKKVAVFLSVIASKTYYPQGSFRAKTTRYCRTIPLLSISESDNEYMAELRRLTTHCEFGAFPDVVTTNDLQCDEILPLFAVQGSCTPPIQVPLSVNNIALTMELDTGAAVTIISEKQYKELFSDTPLRPSLVLLKTYSSE